MKNPKDWYRLCGDAIRAEFGQDADLFIDILAATSPRKQIVANYRLAMRIYHVWKNRRLSSLKMFLQEQLDNLFRGVMKSQQPNVKRALLRQPLSGRKVKAFAENLKGNFDAVTIDVWVCRYYGLIGTLTNREYDRLSSLIRIEAKRDKLKPAEYQAIIWYEAQKQAGKTPKSFLSVSDRNQMFFEYYWS